MKPCRTGRRGANWSPSEPARGVVVLFDNGCRVEMAENQRLDVDSSKPCAALVPQALAASEPAIAAPLAGYLVPGLIGGGAAAGGGGSGGPTTPVSPN